MVTPEKVAMQRKGMEQAAQIADGRPSDRGEEVAAAIRAAALTGGKDEA